jgi:hypothetical protein
LRREMSTFTGRISSLAFVLYVMAGGLLVLFLLRIRNIASEC